MPAVAVGSGLNDLTGWNVLIPGLDREQTCSGRPARRTAGWLESPVLRSSSGESFSLRQGESMKTHCQRSLRIGALPDAAHRLGRAEPHHRRPRTSGGHAAGENCGGHQGRVPDLRLERLGDALLRQRLLRFQPPPAVQYGPCPGRPAGRANRDCAPPTTSACTSPEPSIRPVRSTPPATGRRTSGPTAKGCLVRRCRSTWA